MSAKESQAKFMVQVRPNAPRDEVTGFANGVLQVAVAAPPMRGRANAALVSLLAQLLGIARGQIAIVTGTSSRNKVLAFKGVSRQEVLDRLSALRR